MRERLKEAAEAEVAAAALCDTWAKRLAYDAACPPSGVAGGLRRQLGPVALAVLLPVMGVGMMGIRVSAEFRHARATFCILHRRTPHRHGHVGDR